MYQNDQMQAGREDSQFQKSNDSLQIDPYADPAKLKQKAINYNALKRNQNTHKDPTQLNQTNGKQEALPLDQKH